MNGRIYVLGGSHESGPTGLRAWTVEVSDPATSAWIQKGEMPAPIGAGFGSVVGGKIYVNGGKTHWVESAYGTVEEYSP